MPLHVACGEAVVERMDKFVQRVRSTVRRALSSGYRESPRADGSIHPDAGVSCNSLSNQKSSCALILKNRADMICNGSRYVDRGVPVVGGE
jgi:hypothetical protein